MPASASQDTPRGITFARQRGMLEQGTKWDIRPGETSPVQIILQDFSLRGDLVVPHAASGIVLFAHGSGSSRFSPRNRAVARSLQEARLATLLIDLLSEREAEIDEVTRHLRFDIDLLADRLTVASQWVKSQEELNGLRLGYFGASTGAAAALKAAARLPGSVAAIVSRGGRPDLAGEALAHVTAPTRLIVGERDREVLELNRRALEALPVEKELVIVPKATHLFQEPGAMEDVSRLAGEWFVRHFQRTMH